MDEQKDLPLPETELPKPEKDLPLPEKEITGGNEPETGTIVNNQNSNYEKRGNNLTGKVILTIFLLIFLYPIGIILMWFKTKWPKWLKFLLTIPLILGIIGLIMGGFFLSKITSDDIPVKTSPSVNQVTSPTPIPKQVPLPTLTASEAASWKTYYGKTFTFKYPNNLIFLNNTTNNDSVYFGRKPTQKELTDYKEWYTVDPPENLLWDSFGISQFTDNKINTDLLKYTSSEGTIDTTSTENIQIDGVVGKIFYWGCQSVCVDILFQKNDQVIKIGISNYQESQLATIRKILSTFKFTDEISSAPTLAPITKQPEQTFCTMEAKLCPDGVTYVSRQGPDCEFTKCPTEQ